MNFPRLKEVTGVSSSRRELEPDGGTESWQCGDPGVVAVADHLAAAAGEDRLTVGQAHTLLLAALHAQSADAAAVRGNAVEAGNAADLYGSTPDSSKPGP